MLTIATGCSQEVIPIWVHLVIFVLRIWFIVYDCITYIPYEILDSPTVKLRKSEKIRAKPVKDKSTPWRNIDGPITEDFPGKDTVDKLFTHVTKLFGNKPALGTRELLQVQEEMQPDGRIFEKWVMGRYKWLSYAEVREQIGRIASGIKDFKENNSRAVIFAETRADWLITVLSLFRINVPVVTVYSSLGKEAIIRAIIETEATILITSAELISKVTKIGKKCPTLRSLIYFPPVHPSKRLINLNILREEFNIVVSLDDLAKHENNVPEESPAKRNDLAMIMYTSGTTAAAKGVMLTHYNIVSAIAGLGSGVAIMSETDTYIGYLPLAHILEFCAEMTSLASYILFIRGCRIGYSSPFTLHDRSAKIKEGTRGDCRALKPTLLAAVPTIMDRIYKAVSDELAVSSPLKREIFQLIYERKHLRYQQGYASPFSDRIVFKKIRRFLGGKLRGVLCGGAALNPETQRFMNICMCCPVVQGYGLTETCAAVCVADVNDLSTGTVGPPLRCSQIILRDWKEGGYSPFNDPPQGEILISGANISPGYWKQPEKTAEDFIIIDGIRYFASGDIGEIRKDGSLCIIDRKKDLIKLQHGEYVSLSKIETALLNCSLIDNICCYGNPLASYLVALVVPNRNHLAKLASDLEISRLAWPQLCQNSKVIRAFYRAVEEHAVRNHLLKNELPKKIHLCDEVWTSENGLLTEALKIKRRPIQEKYEKVIAELYSDDIVISDVNNV
ncbi:unnamed protein product [Thelazia callipaeda]|uniref:long-chain-fatty-acid--CoA ligase n=1 Tax=Thelazia callipaeda TaxID=103827 RepID=A0A158RB11_THECL|nr:unnamed protein product [Thelazia callipaeda]